MCGLKAKALVIIALLVLTISAFSIAALGDAQENQDATEPANNIAVTPEPLEPEKPATMKIDGFAIGVI